MISTEFKNKLISITASVSRETKEYAIASKIIAHNAVSRRKQALLDAMPVRDEARKSIRTANVFRQRKAGSCDWYYKIRNFNTKLFP